MAKLVSQTDFTKISDPAEFMRFASQFFIDLVNIVNGKIEFDVNLLTQSISVVFPTANTDVAVTHKLNKTGVKYFPSSKSVSCDVFSGTTANTKSIVYLQCTQATTVTLELY